MADPNRPDADVDEEGEDAERLTLDQEIVRKYDPQALSRMVVRDAGRGEPMDLDTRRKMERRLGGDFSAVRVFRGALAEEITRRYRADAVTVGNTEMILVREGARGGLHSKAGQALLAHELTHVQQQQRGLQFAHSSGGGDGSAHEREAEGVEAAVHAEEHGAQQGSSAEANRMLLDLVKLRVKQMVNEFNHKREMRDGS